VEEELPPPPPPPPAPKVEVPKVQTIGFTTPVLTEQEIVTPPPTQEEMMDTRISNISQEGIKDAFVVVPPESMDGRRGLVTVVEKKEDNLPFTKVEIEAAYMGDWKRFLERNLVGEVPVDNGAAPGKYT